jgi:isochorismate hydrolase
MQNDFVSRLRRDILLDVAVNINTLSCLFERNRLPIYMVVTEHKPDGSDALLRAREENDIPARSGTEGARVVDPLYVPSSASVIRKTKYSAFFGTPLSDLLGAFKGTVVIVGVNTHACVRATAIDACQRDIPVIIPADAVASYDQVYHDESLRYLGSRIGTVVETAHLVDLIQRSLP